MRISTAGFQTFTPRGQSSSTMRTYASLLPMTATKHDSNVWSTIHPVERMNLAPSMLFAKDEAQARATSFVSSTVSYACVLWKNVASNVANASLSGTSSKSSVSTVARTVSSFALSAASHCSSPSPYSNSNTPTIVSVSHASCGAKFPKAVSHAAVVPLASAWSKGSKQESSIPVSLYDSTPR